MRDVNFWTFTGNLTKDPALNHLDDGTPVCHLRVAVSSRLTGAEPSYVDVSAWRRDAERCATYLRKGNRVLVAGPLQASLATLKDGRVVLDLAVDARDVEFMGGPRQGLSPKAGLPALSSSSAAQGSRAPSQAGV